MKNKLFRGMFIAGILLGAGSCGDPGASPSTPATPASRPPTVELPSDLPDFNADTAYRITEAQVRFGPRVPNTPAHAACGDYLIKTLKAYGAEVVVQSTVVTAYTGESLRIRNIMGRLHPELKDRVMLAAHWDTRPFSDRDQQKPKERFDGAVDGASGVAVLLETARIIAQKQPAVGVDIVLFDAEDYGDPQQSTTYCLGSQYFASHPPVKDFAPRFGILLDMVSAPGATFYREGYSMQYAPKVVNRVWSVAEALGYGSYFRKQDTGPVTDDHYFINSIMGIPMIDIIHHDAYSATGFGAYWHTQQDNMENVDRTTMKAVGQTLLGVIYGEKMSEAVQTRPQ